MNRADFIKNNAENFIYIFIPIGSVSAFPSVIQAKRKAQIQYLAHMTKSSNINSIVSEIDQQLHSKYGMGGFALIKRMAAGYNISANGIGAVEQSEEYEAVEVDPSTGFPLSMFSENIESIEGVEHIGSTDSQTALLNSLKTRPVTVTLSSGEILSSVHNNETKKPVGVYSLTTGKQLSKYNSSTGAFESTTSTTADGGNFWSKVLQVMPWIVSLLEWLGSLLGVKKSTEVSAIQTDGWYSTNSNTAFASLGLLPILIIGGIVMYGIAGNTTTGVGKKRKK